MKWKFFSSLFGVFFRKVLRQQIVVFYFCIHSYMLLQNEETGSLTLSAVVKLANTYIVCLRSIETSTMNESLFGVKRFPPYFRLSILLNTLWKHNNKGKAAYVSKLVIGDQMNWRESVEGSFYFMLFWWSSAVYLVYICTVLYLIILRNCYHLWSLVV